MPKELLKKTKTDTVVVRGTITLKQYGVLKNLVGTIGSNEQDVVGKILTLWMYNEGFLKKRQPVEDEKGNK